MSALTEKIAAEHPYVLGMSESEYPRCKGCGADIKPIKGNYTAGWDMHLIEVTETAVREQIEQDIEATWETFALPLPVSTATPDQAKFYRFGYLWATETVKGTP